MLSSIQRVAAISILMLLTTVAAASAQNDVVTTTTGERLVGEIKKLEKDVLTMSTGYSDADFHIEWDKVASIESTRQFLVETFDGRRLSGVLKSDPAKTVTVAVGDVSIGLADLAAMQPFELTFWSRFDVGFDFGYSMTQANSAKQLTFGGNLLYRDKQVVDTVLANVFKSTQSNAPNTQRWDFGNDFRYLLGDRWYANTTLDMRGKINNTGVYASVANLQQQGAITQLPGFTRNSARINVDQRFGDRPGSRAGPRLPGTGFRQGRGPPPRPEALSVDRSESESWVAPCRAR